MLFQDKNRSKPETYVIHNCFCFVFQPFSYGAAHNEGSMSFSSTKVTIQTVQMGFWMWSRDCSRADWLLRSAAEQSRGVGVKMFSWQLRR